MKFPKRVFLIRRRVLCATILAFIVFAAGFFGILVPGHAEKRELVTIQFLNVSDWHGQLDPISVGGQNIGGAAVISSFWKADRLNFPTLTLTAGDSFSGTPPLSSFFNDEPTILAMNLMGFQADTLGNHNFDHGLERLQSLIDLAEFSYVSSNLANVEDNLSGVMPFRIFDVGGVKVAVVGATNSEAPELVNPGNFGTIEVTDPAEAANRARKRARQMGAKIVVAIVHLGATGFDETGNPIGPVVDFANQVHGFDVIFGDHTDVQFSRVINKQLVLENRSRGLTYARTLLTLDPENGNVLNSSVEFVTPLATQVTPDPAIVSLLTPFRQELARRLDGVVGVASDLFPRGPGFERERETALGNLITDAFRVRYQTQLGFTVGGGIRASLPSGYTPVDTTLRRATPGYVPGPPFDLVIGDAFTILPFINEVVTRTVTGAQLHAMLENGVSRINPDGSGTEGRFPQISGFRFTFTASQPPGSRVLSVALADGTPILPDATVYTLATIDFVNNGGDGYTMLADGQGVTRELESDVLLEHLRSQGIVSPTLEGRITRAP